MKIGKRFFGFLLLMVLLLGNFPVVSYATESGTCGENLTWTLDSDGLLTISGTGPMTDYEYRSSPFAYNREIKSVCISNGVTSIGDYAFMICLDLADISIPDSVTSIGESAFRLCNGLTSVTIGNGVTSIGESAFYDCDSLTGITIPDSVTSIGDAAFYWCESLTEITIPDNVTSVGDRAFGSCTDLASVTIGNGVTSIGESAFEDCSSLTQITIPEGVTSIGSSAFSGCSSLTKITIPEGVTSIGNSAFFDCYGLTAIDIPDSVIAIGEYAFSNCSRLISIDIPDGVSRIGNYTFYFCTKLTDISIPEGVTAIGYYAFACCSSLPAIDIPGTVTSIGMSAFEGCDSLTSIRFQGNAPAFSYDCFCGVTATAYYPFGNPTWTEDVMHDHSGDLTWQAYHSDNTHNYAPEITAPTCTEQGYTTYTCQCGDSYMDDYVDALDHDWNEWNQTAAPTCEQVGSKVRICQRTDCGETETAQISAAGHSLGEGNVCTICGQIPLLDSGTCGDNLTWTLDANGILSISGTGEMTDYTISANAPWNQYATQITAIVIEDGVTSVGDRAFRNFQNCTAVTLPDTITDLGMGSFYGMDHLPSITIPSGITAIQDGTFSGCDALTEIVIPQGVTSLGMNSFSYCEGLKAVNIPTSVTTVSSEAFYGCYVLEDVFYAGNTAAWENISIGNYNDPLLNANIHCVEATGNCGYSGNNLVWTFYSDGLLKITGSGSMKDYSAGYNSPFYDYKERINRVILPEGIETIGKYAFQGGYPNLPYIEIPMSVGYIRKNSFGVGYDNVKLKYPGTMAQWKEINHSEYTYDRYFGAECSDGTILYMGECGTNASYDVMGDGTLKITGTGTMSFYQNLQQSSYWSSNDAITRVEIAEGITNIAAYAFKNCGNLKTIVIPASVKTISNDAFYNCDSLTDVYYGGNERGWDSMNIYTQNDPLFSATIHYTDLCKDGHDLQSHEAQAPTCQKVGWGAYEDCSRCYYTTYVEIPVEDHVYETAVTEATCTAEGYTTYTCHCGDTYIGDPVAALGHSHEAVVTAPTCEEGGYTTYTCTVCGDSYIGDETSEAGHVYESVVTPPTCEEGGYTTYTCTVCGDSYIGDETSEAGHVYESVVTLPTCEEGGYTTYTCTVCGDSYIGDETSEAGHVYESAVTPPTCEEGGYTTYTCTVCGDSYIGDETSAEGHEYSSVVTEPNCTEGGYTTNICHCGETYISDEVAKLGHNFGEWIEQKKPSVSEEGLEVRTCDRCGDAETRVLEKLDNPFTDVPEGSWYYEPVMWAVQNGVTTGATETTFDPNGNCLRAHVVTFLHRAAGSPEPTSTNNPFSDVASGAFFYKPVLWAVGKNITNGTSATTFGAMENCNRAAVVTFLWRAKGSPEPKSTSNPFVDVAETAFYYKAVLWAVENGITNGVDATHFGPTAVCNRAQVVTFLHRAYK